MSELLDIVVAQLRGAWRFRWIAVAVAWLLAAAGWAVVWTLPNTYEARTRVYVDTDSVLRPLLAGLAVGTDVTSELNVMTTVLLSRPNLEKVARDTDLYLRARSAPEMENLVDNLRKKILLAGGRDGTWTIAFTDTDPKMARRVVETLLNTFVEDSLGNKRVDSDAAQSFLEQQIKEYEQRLREAEARLADFKRENVGQMPDQTGDYYARLKKALTDVETLGARYRQLNEKREAIARQLVGEEPTFGIVSSSSGGSSDPKVTALRNRLEQLLIQYTDKHPEVIALRETIESLEAERAQRRAESTEAATAMDPAQLAVRALDMNPVYQSMRIALSQAEAEMAEVKSQLADAERAVATLRAQVNVIPEVEARLAQLNRDYEINRAQYTALVQRLESARISREAEQSTDKVKFRIIEPPTVPLEPVGPPRLLFLSMVLVASLGAAVALVFVLNQIWPVFSTRKALEDALGVPVLGSIRAARDPQQQEAFARQPWMLGASVLLLIFVFIGNLVVIR